MPGHDGDKNLEFCCRLRFSPIVISPRRITTDGASHDHLHRDRIRSVHLQRRPLDRPRAERHCHSVPAVRRRHQAVAVAGRHGNDGQNGLWCERHSRARPRDRPSRASRRAPAPRATRHLRRASRPPRRASRRSASPRALPGRSARRSGGAGTHAHRRERTRARPLPRGPVL